MPRTATPTGQPAPGAIDRLLTAITASSVPDGIPDGIFAGDAVLDATVPNWRFSARGSDAVRRELAKWYAHPGEFQSLQRSPLPQGELVEFTLTWTEQGVEHTCHQAHILEIADGLVATDTVWCGGRWPAALVAEMNAAAGP